MKTIMLLFLSISAAFAQTPTDQKLCPVDASGQAITGAPCVVVTARQAASLEAWAATHVTPVLDDKGKPTGAVTGDYVLPNGKTSGFLVVAKNITDICTAMLKDPATLRAMATVLPNDPAVLAQAAVDTAAVALSTASTSEKASVK
jgi:hypothetical protein